jgi:hypothetical protein
MVYMFSSRDRDQIVVDNNRASLDNVLLNSGRRISKKIKALYFTPKDFPCHYSGDRLA